MRPKNRREFREWNDLQAAVERYKAENSLLLERTALRLLLKEKGHATREDMEKMIDLIGWRYIAFTLLRENSD
jgi:hypothetical protein